MALGKQAKVLSKGQIDGALGYIAKTRHPVRNRVIFLLSAKAGLRAKEIASLTWDMVTDADGEVGRAIHLRNEASKGRSGQGHPAERRAAPGIDRMASRGADETMISSRSRNGTWWIALRGWPVRSS